MRVKVTPSQRVVVNIRTRLRRDMRALALSHRGCKTARGCGCLVDKGLAILERAEAQLFQYEIVSYADPTTPRLGLIDGERIASDGDDPAA